jgi:hypothetical protein
VHIVFKIIPLCLYSFTGIVSLIMAYKSIFSTKFLPFHEQAAGKSWDSIDRGLQSVIIALMKVSGLGFLVIALLLMALPIVHYFKYDSLVQYVIPGISFLYCFGLFLVNYQLSVKTKAKTPWKGSLYATIFLEIGIIISFMQ